MQHRAVLTVHSNAGMADDASIRRANLNRFVKARAWTPSDLAARYHGRVSYWRDLLTQPHKSFGEKVARRIEEEAGLPRLWLDQIDADLALAPAHLTAQELPAPFPPPQWPWSVQLWQAVRRLDEDQLAQAEHVLRAHLGLPAS
jgi:hypothetical protein